jgi:P-type Cu+ transporter
MISQIINLLEEASLSKSNIEGFADRISKIFVPTVITLSILTFLIWYFIVGTNFENALLLACSVVVIACPCAL